MTASPMRAASLHPTNHRARSVARICTMRGAISSLPTSCVLVLNCKPFPTSAVGLCPVLLHAVLIVSLVLDQQVRVHHPALDLLPEADKRKVLELEPQRAIDSPLIAPGGHDSHRQSGIHRHVLPSTFDTVVMQIRQPAKIRNGRASGWPHHF